jgi:RluA family pseudouridine synthase
MNDSRSLKVSMHDRPTGTAVKMDIELIWQSDHAIAVNKPAGLSTQAPGDADSLETRLIRQLDRAGRYLAFPHRLDRAVSGVLLVALTKKAARLLSAQFATRKTKKHYSAIVQGKLRMAPQAAEQWEDYMRKVADRSLAEACDPSDPDAKRASTIVKLIGFDGTTNQSRLDLNPITGRMHQLRLQTALRGHPIVGDAAYGATPHGAESECGSHDPAAISILLHARRLGFHDPSSARWLEIEAPCPF